MSSKVSFGVVRRAPIDAGFDLCECHQGPRFEAKKAMKEKVGEEEEQHGLAAMLLHSVSLIVPAHISSSRPRVRTRLRSPIDAADPTALIVEDPKAQSC